LLYSLFKIGDIISNHNQIINTADNIII